MKITEQEVRYVALLAHLELTDEEVKRMTHELDGILAHMDQLRELDTENVEPMAQVLFPGSENATLREDEPHTPLAHEEALANAPLSGAGQFKVPRVIER
ncbi:MAG: aspartyl/glutamyl-tRNA(Asn/Gln) amidotransferase subunit C [Bryobacteraceae bacterium]|nr:MAG: aspartyl/glutamyl-tRNA(Asn/Gln) amidotransferase subunit C [Bryobacteraceae bacterium]